MYSLTAWTVEDRTNCAKRAEVSIQDSQWENFRQRARGIATSLTFENEVFQNPECSGNYCLNCPVVFKLTATDESRYAPENAAEIAIAVPGEQNKYSIEVSFADADRDRVIKFRLHFVPWFRDAVQSTVGPVSVITDAPFNHLVIRKHWPVELTD
jgi:hypothetical protein